MPGVKTINPSAAASIIGVSSDTIRRWCDAGRLTVYRLPSGHRRIPVDEVLDLKLRLTRKPEAAAP